MRRQILGILALAVSSLLVFSGVQPASAAQAKNCAFFLLPTGLGSEPGEIETVPVALGCFSTYSQALAVGSGGSISVSTTTTPASLTDATLASSSTDNVTTSILIGTEWTNINFTASSSSYFASSTCTSSTTWQTHWVGDAWNDLFESGKGFGGCDKNKKFEDADYLGAVVTCTPNCSDYGSLDAEVSSLRWRIG
jgi:hypothetical protein